MNGGIQARGLARAYAGGRERIRTLNRQAAQRPERCTRCQQYPPRPVDAFMARLNPLLNPTADWCPECHNAWSLVNTSVDEMRNSIPNASLALAQKALRIELKAGGRSTVIKMLEARIKSINKSREALIAKAEGSQP